MTVLCGLDMDHSDLAAPRMPRRCFAHTEAVRCRDQAEGKIPQRVRTSRAQNASKCIATLSHSSHEGPDHKREHAAIPRENYPQKLETQSQCCPFSKGLPSCFIERCLKTSSRRCETQGAAALSCFSCNGCQAAVVLQGL